MKFETGEIDVSPSELENVKALIRHFLPDTEAWVYGSRIKGNAHAASDLDLVVFSSPKQTRQVSDLKEAFDESNLPFRVDLFAWNDVPESFRKNIAAEKRILIPPALE